MEKKFIGRKKELQLLRDITQQSIAKFIAITGRRRIGKSRLVEEFAKDATFLKFTGLAPSEGISAQTQREEFARTLSQALGLPLLNFDNWANLFDALGQYLPKQKVVILFDELSWMGMEDPTFLPKIKNLWDDQLKKNPKLTFIVCSSISNWIEENLLSNTGFVGRVHQVLHLEPLTLKECNDFFALPGVSLSAYEKFKILAVTGGVPLYLEHVDSNQSAEHNIKQLCFTKGSLLVREFETIFSDLFSKKSSRYKTMIQVLAKGSLDLKSLCNQLETTPSSLVSNYLEQLIKAGFLSRDFAWDIKSTKPRKKSVYRLSDNYLRFFLKYIEPRLHLIERRPIPINDLSTLDNYHSIMGLQFENLVLQNADALIEALNINPSEVIQYGPYRQSHTKRHAGCQIDLMIQTQFQSLYLIEVKFKKSAVGMDIIPEINHKLETILIPKGFSTRTVLVHVNGLTEELEDSHYFSHVIDFGTLLE